MSIIPDLPTVEQILEDGIEGQIDRSQGMEVMVGHPDSHGRILLSEELPASDGVAVFVPNPFAQSELNDAKQQRRNAEPEDAVPVALTVEEDEVYGLA